MSATVKVVMCGGGGVGKSAISIQRKQVQVDDEIAVLEILDTAGQEEYSAMREQWIRYGEGFFLVYSIIHRPSFERELTPLITQLKRVRDVPDLLTVPLVLFGNKCDLESQRQVSVSEGQQLAHTLGAAFFEGSAKSYLHLDEAYFELVRRIRRDQKGKNPSQSNQPTSLIDAKRSGGRKRGACTLL